MRGCLFTLIVGAVALGLLVVVGLPALAAGVLTAGVTTAGLQADDTTVRVTTDPPTDLLRFHADRVHLTASNATFRGLSIGSLDVVLDDVAILDRTAGAVDGRLDRVRVPDVGGRPVTLASIRLAGGSDAVTATTTLPAAAVEQLIEDAVAAELGTRPTSVSLVAPDRVVVDVGATVSGRLLVTDLGDLVVRVTDGPAAGETVVLLRDGADLPIRLERASVTESGDLRLSGQLTFGLLG